MSVAAMACAVVALTATAPAQAQTVESAGAANAAGVEPGALKIRDWQVSSNDQRLAISAPAQSRAASSVRPRGRRHGPARSAPYRSAQRLLGGVAMGIIGTLGGAMIGAALTQNCHCDDPGGGFVMGAKVGAVAGFAFGMMIVR
jgi:hypothetical protein